MEPTFWQERWARNQIGFHLQQVNPYLQRLWPTLGLAQGARVLVPLCGKSLDMSWLAANGFEVLGSSITRSCAYTAKASAHCCSTANWPPAPA